MKEFHLLQLLFPQARTLLPIEQQQKMYPRNLELPDIFITSPLYRSIYICEMANVAKG